MDHQETIGTVMRWADAEANVRAVVLTGSVVRGDHDSLSDLDIELYVRDPTELLGRRDWYDQFGDLLVVEELPNPGWLPTRLLYLVDGKIDFAVGDLRSFGVFPYTRPFKVLVDKDNRAAALVQLDPTSAATPPTPAQFDECVNWFWAAALMQAKLIVRAEPWLARLRDHDLKAQLLRMIEWDHRSRHGWDTETWYGGKRLGQWADADVRGDVANCWAGSDPMHAVPALRRSMGLFQRLAERTGAAMGFPAFHHDRVRHEVDRILAA